MFRRIFQSMCQTTFIKEAHKEVQWIHGSLPSFPRLDCKEQGSSCGHSHGYGRPHCQDLTYANGASSAPIPAPAMTIATVSTSSIATAALSDPEGAVRLEVLVLIAHAGLVRGRLGTNWCSSGSETLRHDISDHSHPEKGWADTIMTHSCGIDFTHLIFSGNWSIWRNRWDGWLRTTKCFNW